MELKKIEEKYIKKIKETCTFDDPEADHVWADELLIELLNELGMEKLSETYKKIDKWYA